ncbi:MAG TPA: choice-of-anchor D domain-containing protein [Rubrivivax sp.]|nr:choice-of-anchor D domain-containing protein [Rubrivivax sp.]
MNVCRPRTRKTALALAATLALGAAPLQDSLAAACTFNPVSGNWNVAANWSCGTVPGAADTAIVAAGRTATTPGGAFLGATNLNNAGTVGISDNSGLTLLGSNQNTGSISLGSLGNLADLRISGAMSINGTGTITTSNALNNRIIAANGAGDVLTLGAGQSILGAATLGGGGALGLVNNGSIVANLSSGIMLNAQGGVTNNGVLRGDGAVLTIQNTTISQGAAGTLSGLNSGSVRLSNAIISGGSFASGSGGNVSTASGTFGSSIAGVTNGGSLVIVDNSGLTLAGTLTNNGSVSLGSAGNLTDLAVSGAQAIVGNGTMNLSNSGNNRILGANATLTLGSGQTLSGSGSIGAGSTNFLFNNAGTVVATQSVPLLVNASAGVNNTGTLRADGGTLRLQTTINSAGGQIEARNGSRVELLHGAVINDAAFSATGAGSVITTVGGATVSMGGGTVNGPMTIADNSRLRLTADATYNGVLTMASLGNLTDLQIDGARTLSGTATIQASNAQNNRIYGANGAGDSLSTGAGITIQGSGRIGDSAGFVFNNAGSVVATQSTPLWIGGATVNNTGTLRADGGTLQLQTTVNSAGGQIEARNGSRVELLHGAVINDAAFSATGAGSVITTVGGATVSMGGGTVNGPMTIADNSRLRLTADATYNGVLTMASLGNLTDLQIDGARTLSGTATIQASNTQNNRIVAATGAGDALTLGAGITLQGAASIGAGGALGLVNNGALIATLSSGMTLHTSGSVTNNNLIRGDGAAFTINATTVNQGAAGVLSAINGGNVRLTGGSSIVGGSLATADSGAIVTGSGSNARLAGVTNTGTLNVVDNSTLFLDGTLTNDASLNLNSLGNLTNLVATGNRLIDGTGTITLTNTANNRILAAAAGDSLTLGANQTLQGAGSIGAGGALNFTNNGTVIGNLGAGITVSSTGTVTNNKTLRADGGLVTITGTTLGQGAAGVIEAVNNGVVGLAGNAVISGGTLSSASGGQVRTNSGHTATIGNLLNAGTFNVVDNSSLVLQGTVTNDGALNVNSVGNLTNLRVSGAATLGGSGTTTLSNTTNNRIMGQGAGAQLTIGAGQTIQGAGSFGAGSALNIVNLGTISANQSTALTVAVDAASTVQNQAGGLMQAVGSRTLNLNSAVQNNGTIGANGGFVNANAGFSGTGTAITTGTGVLKIGAASTVGTLINDGSAAGALALGSNNLTVSGDYTSANWGSGNGFNSRANVSGSGQILAGGDAAQVISGAGVTGGNTANATLTLGSMRVGANTFTYRIGNAGSSGPTLRGAIQTTVNGGNISDARLSGSGVTAANYNAGAPGGNSGDLAVTFTAASAGTLAPLGGQVLNLRSNFDNIADQKLNIVLAGGAAAYNAAVGAATPDPVVIANQRVGGSASQALTVSNTAAAGAFSEDLRASFGSNSGAATNNGGSINALLAGSSDSSSLRVGVDTSSAGSKSGSVTLNYQTTGTVGGVSNGLALAGANAPQTINVSGHVYQAASGQLVGNVMNFGTLQVGQQVSQDLVVRNTASGPAGFVEDLNASFGAAGNAQISGSGSLSGITAGSDSTAANGTMTVTVTGSTAGALNSGITVNYFSAGEVGGASNGLGVLSVGSEFFGVNGTISAVGNVINQASPQFGSTSVNLGAVRVGAASPTASINLTNQATATPQAALNASIASNGAPVTASGSVSLLAPGASSSALQVGLNTAVAGNFTGVNAGSATVQLVSDASNVGGCAPNCQLNLAPQAITVSGKVYTAAVGQLDTPVIDFGIVRVGDTVSARNITVSNTAAATALNDTLRAELTGLAGPLSAGGPVTGVAAQGSGNLTVALSTASAGVFNASGSVSFLSQNPDMADVSAGADATVQVMAQVNNLANADFDLLSGLGTLSDDGNGHYLLDLGSLALGGNGSWMLQLDNEVGGPADALLGAFDLSGADDFILNGWGSVGNLLAGQAQGGLEVGFVASALGLFEDEIVFNGWSSNGWGADLAQVRSLKLRARVFDPGSNDVPEPGTLALLVLGMLLAQRSRARRARAGDGAGA